MGTTLFTEEQLAEAGGGGGGGVLAFGVTNVNTTTATRYLRPGGLSGGAAPSTISVTETPFPFITGTLQRLSVRHNSSGVGGNITYTVMLNGSPTDLAVTMLASDTSGSSTAGTATIVFDDTVAIEVTKAGSLTSSPQNVISSVGIT